LEIFKAKEVKAGEIPPVDGLDLLKLQVEEPMRWSESYDMYGERTFAGKFGDPSDYSNYGKFKAKCKLCEQFSEQFYDSWKAKDAHFMHCAREHGYIFPEDTPAGHFYVRDVKLQSAIEIAMLYDFPMPGYEEHKKCIKQRREDKIICVIHEGNELRTL
jgi:hypothetical protein